MAQAEVDAAWWRVGCASGLVAAVLHAETAYDGLSLATGALAGPFLAAWLALHLSRG